MIRQHHDSIDREPMPCSYVTKGHAQCVDVRREQARSAVSQIDGEEVAGAWGEVATVVGQGDGFRCAQPILPAMVNKTDVVARHAPGTLPDCGAGSTICGPPRSMLNTANARRTWPSDSSANQPSAPTNPDGWVSVPTE